MGQAKARGNFHQRKAEAEAKAVSDLKQAMAADAEKKRLIQLAIDTPEADRTDEQFMLVVQHEREEKAKKAYQQFIAIAGAAAATTPFPFLSMRKGFGRL